MNQQTIPLVSIAAATIAIIYFGKGLPAWLALFTWLAGIGLVSIIIKIGAPTITKKEVKNA